MKTSLGKLSAISPAEYKISVMGFLDENMSERLGGLTILNENLDQSADAPMVTLTGQLTDQASLFGALNALYTMRMPLLAVECIGVREKKGKNPEK
ncbi:MAG: hypothetical protein MUO67_03230 [Anaerolineales bacterium]|nr:hypothetical protein [Anaerolineales bacterium]